MPNFNVVRQMNQVMKKCILMFAVLITVLLLAVFTDVEKNPEFEQELGIRENLNENLMVGATGQDSIR